MAAPRRPSLGAASNVIEFGMPERRRSAARPRSVSHLDLSALSKRDQPDAARARTPAMVLKGESMTSLGAPGNMSPCVFPQTPDGIVQHPSKEAVARRHMLEQRQRSHAATPATPRRASPHPPSPLPPPLPNQIWLPTPQTPIFPPPPPSVLSPWRPSTASPSPSGTHADRAAHSGVVRRTVSEIETLTVHPSPTRAAKQKIIRPGRLKSARLSQFLGRQIPGQVPVDQITDQRNKALHRVHSPVDRQAAPSRSDFTNEIKVHAESIHRSNRATTVPTHIGPRMFEPLANAAPESERPKTVATQRGNMTGTEERKIRRSLVVTLGPRQANSVMFGQRGEHGAMAATGDSLRKAPTPCPSICVAPELPDIQRKRFVQLRPLTSPDVFMTTHKQFIVSMGRVVRDSDAYQHFLILASRVFPEPAIEFLVQRIERFCANYMVRWAECSYERLIAILSRPILRLRFCETDMLSCLANDKEARPAWNQSYRVNFCLELIRVRVQVDAVTSTAGQRYRAKDGFMAAVVKIQATWRMHKLRVIHLEFVEKLRAGERFRQKWLIRRLISRIQASREKRHQDHLAKYRALQATLRTEWAELKTKKRIILHLPSMTFGTTTCAKYENMHSWQIRQLGRLIDLLDPNVSVIYVTTLLSADVERFLKQTIGFTFDLSELIRAKRLLLITLKKPEFCAETVSLAGILMCTPVALRKISSFIKDQQAYMVPAACGRAELDLAHAFNIPVYGSFEANLELAHCRTAQRDIIIRSGVPHTPGASRLKDERSLYHELDRLIKQHPHITRWLFKIDKEMEGRGIAYVDVRELHAESESAHDEDEVDAETTTSRLLRGSVLSHCNHPLRDKMYRCVHFLRRDLWTSWNHYLKSFLFFGGVIEACAPHADHESESLEYPIVHFLIEPDNAVKILATSSLICLHPLRPWAATFPQRSVDHSKLVAFVDLVARDCIDRGIMGHITCEFVAWKLADMFEHTIWCTAIKPHFTENMSQAYFMLLMTACPALHPDGKIYYDLNLARRLNLRYLSKVPYVDMDKVRQVSNTERIYDEADYEERVGIYAPRLIHQNLEVLDSRLFGGLCLESGIVFDSKWKSGTHIPLVECYGKQSYAMMCINRNLETALEMMLQNIVIIARRLTGPVAVHSNFMEVAQHLSHMLSNVRPYSYVHKPAVTKASPNAQKLSDLENALNNHIALPVSRMLGLLEELGKLKDDRSSKRGMSPTTINLLNAGIPSKMLANFYSDFGREKLEVPDKSSKRNATRVPPGLPMDEYMAIMEHLAGLDDDGAEEVSSNSGAEANPPPPMPLSAVQRRSSATRPSLPMFNRPSAQSGPGMLSVNTGTQGGSTPSGSARPSATNRDPPPASTPLVPTAPQSLPPLASRPSDQAAQPPPADPKPDLQPSSPRQAPAPREYTPVASQSGPHQSADPAAMRVAIMRGQSLAVFKEEKPVRTPSPLAKPRRRSTIGPASPDRLSTATSPVPDSPSVGGVQAPSRRGSSRRASEMDIPVAKLAAQPRVRWTQSMARIDSEAAATSTPGTETPPAAAAFKRRLPDRR